MFLKNTLKSLKGMLIAPLSEQNSPQVAIFPFLSGDLFLAMADVAVIKNYKPIILRDESNLLFVEVDMLETPGILEYADRFKVVILHNGDNPPSEIAIEQFVRSGVKIFATNVKDEPPNIFVLPIGIENAHHQRNGSIQYYNILDIASKLKNKSKNVLVSFSTATNRAVREPIENSLLAAGYSNVMMDIDEYRIMLARSRFVISPPGNGVDCHRTWEAFYHKTIPVVERRNWYFGGHKLPALVVDNMVDFISMNERQMEEVYGEIMAKGPYEAIFFDYWMRFIRQCIDNSPGIGFF